MKKIINFILLAVFLLLFGMIFSGKFPQTSAIHSENQLRKNAPIDIPDSSITTIQEIKDTNKPTIVLFYVDWCGYCKRFMPIYGEVAKQYGDKYNFAIVHCEKPENEQMVKDFGIHGYPSLFIIDKKIDYNFPLSGSVTQDEEALKKELDRYLKARSHFTK